ncbi:MAG: helix-turn-helix transcriptional regulator [Actinobacteria bacterium]|nr:helix-turn-helix transcriptional regulator [Actinomycetota bacterium]
MLTERILGRNIERARQYSGLSQSELANLIGLDRSAISRIESGERRVDSIELVNIARALGISESSLLKTEETEILYLRAPEGEQEEIKQQVEWVNDFLEKYEFLKEIT